VTRLEPASFEVERFEFAGNACLEIRGRWFGVRGRRFMRPALTAVTDGREQRMLAVLDHKPWNAEEGETWLAAFPCSTDPTALIQAELTVAPDVTVPLPPPSAPPAARRARRGISEREQLRDERRQALEARDAAIAERQESIEAEVRRRLEDLRAEAERERAGARLAAQAARERDEARAARALAVERDRLARDRDDAVEERDRIALVLTERELLESEPPPVIAERAPLMPRLVAVSALLIAAVVILVMLLAE